MQQQIEILNTKGLHARPAAKLSKLANTFPCQVLISYGELTVNAKSIIELMMLGVGCGGQITVTTCGVRQEQALEAVVELIAAKFNEE